MNENSTILTEKEKKLIKKLYMCANLMLPMLIGSFLIEIAAAIPVIIIDIITLSVGATPMILSLVLPPIPFLICACYTYLFSKITVQSENWQNIIYKAYQNANDANEFVKEQEQTKYDLNKTDKKRGGAIAIYFGGIAINNITKIKEIQQIGTAIGGVLVGIHFFELGKIVSDHVKQVADIFNIPLPNKIKKRIWLSFVILPLIILQVLLSIVLGIKSGNAYNNTKQAQQATINTVQEKLTNDENISVVTNTYDRDKNIVSVDLRHEINDNLDFWADFRINEDNTIKEIDYTLCTDDINDCNKEEFFNIFEQEVVKSNNLVQKLDCAYKEVVALYLPTEECKQTFLSTPEWQDLHSSPKYVKPVTDAVYCDCVGYKSTVNRDKQPYYLSIKVYMKENTRRATYE